MGPVTPDENSLFLHVYPSLTKNEGSAPIFSFLTIPLIAEVKKEGIGTTSYFFLEVSPMIAIAEIGDLFSRALYIH